MPFTLQGRAAAAAFALAAAGVVASAQAPRKPADVPTFGVTTELVYLRFHVETKGGYARDLTKEQIRVLEDGRPQTVALLETPSTRERSIPPEVTLLFDVSGSVMDERLLDEELVRDVFLASLSEQTTVGLCAFGGELRCLTPPTREVRALLAGFEDAVRFGWETRRTGSRLYASVADVCAELAKGDRAQRALVIFSDGLENRGGKVEEAIRAADEADVRVYAVKLSQAFQDRAPAWGQGRGGLGAPPGPSGGFGQNRAQYDYKKFELDKLAAETGGRTYEPGKLDKRSLGEILRSIATEVTMECVLGYASDGAPTGRKRRVKVELVDKSLGKIRDGERTLLP